MNFSCLINQNGHLPFWMYCLYFPKCSITPSVGIWLFVVCSTCSIVPGGELFLNAFALTKRLISVQMAKWGFWLLRIIPGKYNQECIVFSKSDNALQWSRVLYWWLTKLGQFCSSLRQISCPQGAPQQSLIPTHPPTHQTTSQNLEFGKKLVVDAAPPLLLSSTPL